jgi:N-acylneuraminate cytidylyltransferase
MGINLLAKAGVNMLVLSKEVNPVVQARAKKLNLPCIQGCDDKVTALQKYMKENNFDQNGLVYVGNDINDVPAMGIAAFNVAPSDAHVSVFPHTDLVLGAAGGFGAVRELADLILTRFSASLN